ncbi:hypothetical protein H0A36_16515 [Endozoicomonas sp. SM1973]|uniref:Uncharacterized protein n=1 Tax=Spartinivicinus marinus TaxID=2994442 RepID=A0A853IDM5_9GAMM|nr:hypothetical protein [Spartinivicinus marinus]MCX4028804.1 hypothetical protein [Spartinivicinus marinus]NYZ67617.1 hypothetical protein [Spartinivicinus marinus]
MKVVYFDYWTVGIHNFLTIDEKLKKNGCETMLFHIGSFNNPVKEKEIINNIECYDISFYKTKFIYEALKTINPDVIISLNTTYILDRALILACRALGIKSVFMMHGTRAVGKNLDIAISDAELTYGKLIPKLMRLKKYVKLTIPNYFYSKLKNRDSFWGILGCLNVLIDTYRFPGRSFYLPKNPYELIHDRCLVYSNQYIEYYKKLGYSRNKITVTGNPKQDPLFQKLMDKSFCIDELPLQIKEFIDNNQKYAVYIEESFVESDNLYGWTNDLRNKHLNEIAIKLKKYGYNLVVKLHPSTNIDNINVNTNIILAKSVFLDNLVYFSDFAISHISSAADIAILLEKPLLVPTWGISKSIIDYYISNEVANPWNNLDDEISLSINIDKRREYILNNITITKPVAADTIVNNILKI